MRLDWKFYLVPYLAGSYINMCEPRTARLLLHKVSHIQRARFFAEVMLEILGLKVDSRAFYSPHWEFSVALSLSTDAFEEFFADIAIVRAPASRQPHYSGICSPIATHQQRSE